MSHALLVNNLRKTYPNGHEALRGVDLHVQEGDFFALLGPNGAGKSTLIGIVCSLVRRSSGSVAVFGLDTQTHLEDAKSCIGVVPQEFNFNIWEPVVEILVNQAGYYGIDHDTALVRAETYLRKLGLWEKRRSQARDLSGGMKRRLMIARALVHEPRLLILDEPTAGVDIELRRSMWAFLREINARGTTIILTTHYLEEAETLCENIAIIDDGEIVEDTNMKALLERLHTETFLLDLREPVKTLPPLGGYTARAVDPTTLEVEVSRAQSINGLFAELTRHGLHVVSMRNKANRLEELFLRLVSGEEGRPDEAAAPRRAAAP